VHRLEVEDFPTMSSMTVRAMTSMSRGQGVPPHRPLKPLVLIGDPGSYQPRSEDAEMDIPMDLTRLRPGFRKEKDL